MDRLERLDERPETIEIRRQRRPVLPPIDVVARAQTGQVRVDEILLIAQVWHAVQPLVELREHKPAVNIPLAESAAIDVVQIVDDQLDEIGIIGPSEA